MNTEPTVIGITGNYGSGKSVFCTFLREQGYTVISADEIAQQQLDDADSLKHLIKRWGKDIIHHGKPDRKKIAEIVFKQKSELDFLNSILHPKTLVALQNILDNYLEKFLFIETPLLFEAGMQSCFDYIVLVRTDKDKRIKRLMKSGKITLDEIQARNDAQIDDLVKMPLCNLVIDNNGSLNNLRNHVDTLLSKLASIKPKDKIPFSS